MQYKKNIVKLRPNNCFIAHSPHGKIKAVQTEMRTRTQALELLKV